MMLTIYDFYSVENTFSLLFHNWYVGEAFAFRQLCEDNTVASKSLCTAGNLSCSYKKMLMYGWMPCRAGGVFLRVDLCTKQLWCGILQK